MIARAALLLLATLGLGVPAHAQLSPGTSGQSSAPVAANEEEYAYMLRQLGPCLVRTKPERAAAFLDAPIDSSAEGEAFGALFNREANPCLQNFVRVNFVRSSVRGAVAEGLFKRRMRGWPAGAVPAVAQPDTIGSIHDFAQCYVARDFDAARGLIEDTRLGDRDELRRMREMAPGFGDCLPEGSQLSLKPMNIRMALAEALHHATKADPVQPGTMAGREN